MSLRANAGAACLLGDAAHHLLAEGAVDDDEAEAGRRDLGERIDGGLDDGDLSAALPETLADLHIALRGNEGGASIGGLELEPALEHDDGAGHAE